MNVNERRLAGLDSTIGSRDSRGRGWEWGSDQTPPQAAVGTEVAQAVPG